MLFNDDSVMSKIHKSYKCCSQLVELNQHYNPVHWCLLSKNCYKCRLSLDELNQHHYPQYISVCLCHKCVEIFHATSPLVLHDTRWCVQKEESLIDD
ncbi:hypothetical protein GJ496_002879 [Pomphorhynchus laevis]|nr:hypothetical protein GJ496_002879 [Pomphorhynchus laevis]